MSLGRKCLSRYVSQSGESGSELLTATVGAEAAARSSPSHHEVQQSQKYGSIDVARPSSEPPAPNDPFASTDLSSRRMNQRLNSGSKPAVKEFEVEGYSVDVESSNEVIQLARTLFDEADADDNGKIDQPELHHLMIKLWRHMGMRLNEEGTLREPVDHHEKICNGGRWIIIEEDVRKMMECFDVDHDGLVDFAELCGILGTEPWVKAFPNEARPGLDAAVARVLREWQTSRADPVLVDRMHQTAAEIERLEQEKQQMEAAIAKDRAETMARWEADKYELQQQLLARDALTQQVLLAQQPAPLVFVPDVAGYPVGALDLKAYEEHLLAKEAHLLSQLSSYQGPTVLPNGGVHPVQRMVGHGGYPAQYQVHPASESIRNTPLLSQLRSRKTPEIRYMSDCPHMGSARDEYYHLLQEQAKRLGFGH